MAMKKNVDINEFVVVKQGNDVIENKYTWADLDKAQTKLWYAMMAATALLLVVIFGILRPNFKFAYTASSSMVPTLSVGDLASTVLSCPTLSEATLCCLTLRIQPSRRLF